MNYISVCLLIFYSSLSFCQSYDNELSADFRRNSDSLKEIGKYESALSALTWSNSYKPKDLRTEEYQEKYNAKRKYLDSIIDCCVTDSMKCGFRLEQALYHIEKGSRGWAYNWMGEAERYCNDSEYFNSTLMKIFSPHIPDTIWINYKNSNYNGMEIIRYPAGTSRQLWRPRGVGPEDSIYLHRDTSLYSGLLIDKIDSRMKGDSPYPYGSFEIFQVKNGVILNRVKHEVFNDPQKSSIKTSDPTRKKIMNYFDENHYYYGIVKRNGNLRVYFYPNGDTLRENIKRPGPAYSEYGISYYPNGDTKHYSLQRKTDTNTFSIEARSWDQNNNLIYKWASVNEGGVNGSPIYEEDIHFNEHGDTLHYKYRDSIWFKDMEFNKYGDTIKYQYFDQHQRLQGIQYMSIFPFDDVNQIEDDPKEPYILKAVFSKDSLKTILNRDIIYLDKRFRQISQSEYIELIAPVLSTGYEIENRIYSLAESYEINGVTYNAVGCFGLKGRIKKLRKKLKQME